MIIEVEMLAFANGEIRNVEVPDEICLVEGWKEIIGDRVDNILGAVFHYGQNDFQPQNHPSVSAGDVIRWNGEHYLVASVGFIKLTNEQMESYRSIERRERTLARWKIEADEELALYKQWGGKMTIEKIS
jgi:hypothetical protein